MNLWATAAQAAVYTTISFGLGMYYKRLIKRDREKLERILTGVEAVFGIAPADLLTEPKVTLMNTLAQYRKAIAAGLGVILTGALTWLSGTGVLASLLEPVVPDALKPLIGVLAGGIATVVAVIRTTNVPATATAAATVPAVAVPQYTSTSTTETSLVSLLPAPELSYM